MGGEEVVGCAVYILGLSEDETDATPSSSATGWRSPRRARHLGVVQRNVEPYRRLRTSRGWVIGPDAHLDAGRELARLLLEHHRSARTF